MKVPGRKVLKLGVSQQDLDRFVKAAGELEAGTLSATLTKLLDTYEKVQKFEHFLPSHSLKWGQTDLY